MKVKHVANQEACKISSHLSVLSRSLQPRKSWYPPMGIFPLNLHKQLHFGGQIPLQSCLYEFLDFNFAEFDFSAIFQA